LTLSRCAAFALVAGVSFTGGKLAFAQTSLPDIFQSELTCALISPLLADMPVEPVYTLEGLDCTAVLPDDSDSIFFTDPTCLTPLDYETTSLASHCSLLADSDQLGEGAGITTPVWTLSPGSRLDVGARPLEGVVQPYLQRLIYRTINTDRGVCSLEMRVYATSPAVGNEQIKPSLLALHGGSWSARGFGFFGLELTIPHYVEQGFVVYAPFYRLLGDSEGSAACNQASILEVAEDASAALAWVAENAASYGSSSVPVVFGQSAGAHLATSLLVNEPENVAGAVLFYPPTDFTGETLQAVDVEVDEIATLREVIACGDDSELHLIREGQHALDVCFASSLLATDACPSGSNESRLELSMVMPMVMPMVEIPLKKQRMAARPNHPAQEEVLDTGGWRY